MKRRTVLAILLGALLGTACGAQHPNARFHGSALLHHVPADTPYLITVLEPTPRAELDHYLALQRKTFHVRVLRMNEQMGGRMPRLLKLIFDELEPNLSADGLDKLGFGAGATMAIYGIGIYPALRMRIKDPQAVGALFGRIVASEGGPPAASDGHGKHWTFPVGKRATAILAVTDTELLAGLAPTSDLAWFRDRLYGDADPGPTLDESPRLDEVMATYALSPRFVAWLDFATTLRAATTTGSLIDRQLRTLGGDREDRQPFCKEELVSLVAHMPRLIVGALEASATRQRLLAMLELDPDLARDLASLKVSAVGVGAPLGQNIASFGIAVDVPRLIGVLRARARQQLQAPARCPMLSGMNELAQKLDTELGKPIPPYLPDLRAFAAELADVQPGGLTPNVRGAVVVSASDPIRLIDIAKRFLPQLPSINPPPDGKPVKVPGGVFFVETYVAMRGQLLGLGVGEGSAPELVRLMAERPLPSQPVAAFAADVARLAAASRMFGKGASGDEGLTMGLEGIISVTLSPDARGLRFEMVREDRR
jgi:hypothetical protein